MIEPGLVIGNRYRLEERIGAGGFAVVWRATHLLVDRPVAVKLLTSSDADVARRLAREARALGQIKHPNCVEVFDSGTTEDGVPYLVLEYVAGSPLSSLRGQRLPIGDIVSIATQVADALTVAHRLGVTHRDLKPENIMVRHEDTLTVKVLDFGIARIEMPALPDITKTGEVVGTPHYMSPEQLRGAPQVGPPSDIYSLGVMLYELVEGQRPFRGFDLLAIGMSHITEAAPSTTRRECPAFLSDLIAACLQKNPAQRPDATAVAGWLRGEGRPAPAAVDVAPAPSRVTLPAIIGGVVGAGLVVAAMWWGEPPPKPRRVVRPVPATIVTKLPETAIAPEDAGMSTVDVTAADATVDGNATGCGKQAYDLGFRHFGDPETGVTRFVPEDYDSERRYPLVLMLRGGNEDARSFVETSGLLEVARRESVILVAPDIVAPEVVVDVVEGEFRDLCVDRERVFIVSQAPPPRDLSLFCEPWVRGVATHSLRTPAAQSIPACPNGRVFPMVALWPMRSGILPIDGGTAPRCAIGPSRSIQYMESTLAQQRGCSRDLEVRTFTDGTCTPRQCEVPFLGCRLDGGWTWPGTPRRRTTILNPGMQGRMDRCDGPDSNFPAAETVWAFFASLPANERPNATR